MTASSAAAAPISIGHIEYGAVIPAGSPDAIPAAKPAVDALMVTRMQKGTTSSV